MRVLTGLQYDPNNPHRIFGHILRAVLLQLFSDDDLLLPADTSIFLSLIHPQRAQMVLKHRALLELMVKLISAPATQ